MKFDHTSKPFSATIAAFGSIVSAGLVACVAWRFFRAGRTLLRHRTQVTRCFVEIVTTSQSIDELNYFPNCDTLQARQPFGNYSVLLYLYFTVIIFLIRLLCVTYRFRTTLTKNKQQFETHGFGCVSQQNIRNQMNHHG